MRIFDVAKLVAGSTAVFLGVVTCGGVAEHLADTTGAGGGSGASSARSSGKGGTGGHGGGIIGDAYADESGSRLKANYVTGADGSKHYTGTFFDSQRNEDCSFQQMADGTYLCLPTDGVGTVQAQVFSDSGCTQPVTEVAPPQATLPGICGESPTARYLVVIDNYCVTSISSTHLVSCYTGQPGSCVPLSVQCAVADPPIPLSSFASGTKAHD